MEAAPGRQCGRGPDLEVEPGSVADDADLRPGDVLLELNKAAVSSPRPAGEAGWRAPEPGTDILFLVKRGQPGHRGDGYTLPGRHSSLKAREYNGPRAPARDFFLC